MKYNRLTRRMFLRGAGGVLAIPVLESLIPRAYAQAMAAPAVRYIQMINPYASSPRGAFGDDTVGIYAAIKANPALLQTVSPNVRKAALSALPSGDLGYLWGTELSNLRSKISILRGLDVLGPADNRQYHHNFTLPTCAFATNVTEYAPPPQPSIDCLLADSSKIYPVGFPITRRLINLGPAGADSYYSKASFSYQRSGADIKRVPLMQSTTALLDLFSGGQENQNSAIQVKLSSVMDKVFADYKTVESSSRISASDKVRLQNYMDLISDIKNGLGQSAIDGSCTSPSVGPDTTAEEQFNNQIRILAAAMACGSTRVASIAQHFALPGIPDAHGIHHQLFHNENDPRWTNTLSFYNNLKGFSKRMASLISLFDSIADKDGTSMLQNSIIYWASEYGLADGWGQHSREDFAVVVAGGGGGKLQQGNFIDYRKYNTPSDFYGHNGVCTLRGIPLNNLLVTFMNCMGLDHTDYELSDGSGYGLYPAAPEGIIGTNGVNKGQKAIPDEEFWFSKAGRRTPVPVLYKG